MDGWKDLLKADPTDWLLEESDPSVRYFTLRWLVGLSDADERVGRARRQIMTSRPVSTILARQTPDDWWGNPPDYYIRSKYKGTSWTLILLAELGADGSDPCVVQACEFILKTAQERGSGAFAFRGSPDAGGDRDAVIPCLTGNMLFSLARLGFAADARVQAGLQWIIDYQRSDDGDGRVPQAWPYAGRENCWGRHTCHLGVVKALKAMAEIPAPDRPQGADTCIQRLAEYLLDHQIFFSSHNPGQVSMPRWQEYGFPHMWDSDVLEVLGILTQLGYQDERLHRAVHLTLSKQDDYGRWKMERSLNGRMAARIEKEGEASKWVTLYAMRAVKEYYGVDRR